MANTHATHEGTLVQRLRLASYDERNDARHKLLGEAADLIVDMRQVLHEVYRTGSTVGGDTGERIREILKRAEA